MLSIKKHIAIILATSALSASALADGMGMYVGADLGGGRTSVNTSGFGSESGNGTAWRLFEGYQFNENVAAELDIGGISPANLSNFGLHERASLVSGSVLGIWPLEQGFGVFGRLGIANMHATVTDNNGGESLSNRAKGLIGIGGTYKLDHNFTLRAELDYYGRMDNDDAGDSSQFTTLTVGAAYTF